MTRRSLIQNLAVSALTLGTAEFSGAQESSKPEPNFRYWSFPGGSIKLVEASDSGLDTADMETAVIIEADETAPFDHVIVDAFYHASVYLNMTKESKGERTDLLLSKRVVTRALPGAAVMADPLRLQLSQIDHVRVTLLKMVDDVRVFNLKR